MYLQMEAQTKASSLVYHIFKSILLNENLFIEYHLMFTKVPIDNMMFVTVAWNRLQSFHEPSVAQLTNAHKRH